VGSTEIPIKIDEVTIRTGERPLSLPDALSLLALPLALPFAQVDWGAEIFKLAKEGAEFAIAAGRLGVLGTWEMIKWSLPRIPTAARIAVGIGWELTVGTYHSACALDQALDTGTKFEIGTALGDTAAHLTADTMVGLPFFEAARGNLPRPRLPRPRITWR
jgi:hypothetical protein